MCEQLQEPWKYLAGLFSAGVGSAVSELSDVLLGCMIGPREDVDGENSGSAVAITNFLCRHLKSLFISDFIPWLLIGFISSLLVVNC